MNVPHLALLQREILTEEDADQALHLLGWISSTLRARRAALDLKIAELEEAHRQECRIEIEGTSFTFGEVTAALEANLREFAARNRERLFQRSKTYRLSHGEIRLRKQMDRLALAEGETPESVLPRIEHDERLVKRRTDIDLASIRALRRKGLISDEQLQAWGLQFVPGDDQILIEPAKGD